VKAYKQQLATLYGICQVNRQLHTIVIKNALIDRVTRTILSLRYEILLQLPLFTITNSGFSVDIKFKLDENVHC